MAVEGEMIVLSLFFAGFGPKGRIRTDPARLFAESLVAIVLKSK
jgi:hypothetical protein